VNAQQVSDTTRDGPSAVLSQLLQRWDRPVFADDELCIAAFINPRLCIVMRNEGKGTGQIDRQCVVHTACP